MVSVPLGPREEPDEPWHAAPDARGRAAELLEPWRTSLGAGLVISGSDHAADMNSVWGSVTELCL